MFKFICVCCCLCSFAWSAACQGVEVVHPSSLQRIAEQEQMDVRILQAIAQEAHFNPSWVGVDGRYGMMQLTFDLVQQEGGLEPAQLFHPEHSTRFAARYLKRLMQLYQSDLKRALLHYYQAKSSATPLRLHWLSPGRSWADRVYKVAVAAGVEPTAQSFPCDRPPYLDDFADPNSRLNHLKQQNRRCRANPYCQRLPLACSGIH